MKLKAELILEVLVLSSKSVTVPSTVSVEDQDVQKTIIFLPGFCGCYVWSFTLRKKYKLWRFEKRVMRGKKNCNQGIWGMWPIRILLNEHLLIFMGYVV
jgi:hypothetical protein